VTDDTDHPRVRTYTFIPTVWFWTKLREALFCIGIK
jgi:hypothetical protein